jgi:hypothetical protein
MRRAGWLTVLALAGCPSYDDAYDACRESGLCREVTQVSLSPLSATLEATPAQLASTGFVVENSATTATPVLLATLEGDGFELSRDECSGRPLAGGQRCSLEVTFHLFEAGERGARVTVGTALEPIASATLVGHVVDGAPVSIRFAGKGAGTVSAGATVCAKACTVVVERGQARTLVPAAASGSAFRGWAGDCTGGSECIVDGLAPHSVVATFELGGPTLTLATDGPGWVTPKPAGTSCGPGCIAYPSGTKVTLTAKSVPGQSFTGWSQDCSGTQAQCLLTMTTTRAATASFTGPNLIFTTSGTIAPGALGGIDGGVEFCRTHAEAAGLYSPFVPWLSVPGDLAVDRLGAAARGWIRTDGVPFADTLASHRIYYPPMVDESGYLVPLYDPVATGTRTDGTAWPTNNCSGWTSQLDSFHAGDPGGGSVLWTDEMAGSVLSLIRPCSKPSRLYCLQAGRSQPTTPSKVPASGRRLFLGTERVTGNMGGLAGADTRCQNMATDAGLPGTYLAFLSGSGAATTRVPADIRYWYRPDGVMLAKPAGLEGVKPRLYAAPNVTADSQYLVTDEYGWLGSASASGGFDTCQGWTSASSGSAGTGEFLSCQAIEDPASYTGGCHLARLYLCAQQ